MSTHIPPEADFPQRFRIPIDRRRLGKLARQNGPFATIPHRQLGQGATLKRSIGFALLPSEHAAAGQRVSIDIRGTRAAAEIVPAPIYRRPAKPKN